MAIELIEIQRFGLIDVILWMLSFAIIYGVLSQIGKSGMPAHKGSRAIISIVLAFMVLFSAPAQLAQMIAKLSSSFLLVILGLLALIIIIEAAGVKLKITPPAIREGEELKSKEVSIFEAYGKYFGIALIFITLILFIGAGGLQWIGLADVIKFGKVNVLGAGLFIMIILAIIWMIAEKPEKS